MEIPDISIPKIDIPTINIPISPPYQVLNVPPPSLKLPGCVRYHRDASPKNTALYDDDPRGHNYFMSLWLDAYISAIVV